MSSTSRQRADRFNVIGKPKSAAGERAKVPFGKFVANTLKEWKLACPKADSDSCSRTVQARSSP